MFYRTGILFAAATVALFGPNFASAGYMPSEDEIREIRTIMANPNSGMNFAGGRMLWVGGFSHGEDAAGFYEYGDGMIHWRLEEREKTPVGGFHVVIWKFYADRARQDEIYTDANGDIISFPKYDESVDMNSGVAAEKSAKTLKLLVTVPPNRMGEVIVRAHH